MSSGIQAALSTTGTSSTSGTSSSSADPFSALNLTSTQQTQIQSILAQLQSGSITPDQARSEISALLTPQQQQTLQTEVQNSQNKPHHHHHHAAGSSDPSTDGSSSPLAQLNLTSSQQSQINQLVANAQSNDTSPADLLNQIDAVLTDSQKQQLANLISAYTSGGTPAPTSTPSVVVNTSA